MIKPLPIEREDERGTNFSIEDFTLCNKKKGSVSGDHSNNEHEEIYVLNGSIEMTIGDESTIVNEPSYIYILPAKYRKVVALTDTQFLVKKWNV